MKKFSLCFTLLILMFSSFNAPAAGPTNKATIKVDNATIKVETIFNGTFKEVKNVQWYTTDNTYSARFTTNNVIQSITYDKNGKFIRSTRCFGEELLPANVLARIKEKYKDKTIRLITEIVEGNELVYSLTIDDDINCWIVAAGPSGYNELLTKFKKQQ